MKNRFILLFGFCFLLLCINSCKQKKNHPDKTDSDQQTELTDTAISIKGIDTLISQKIEIPVYVADRPLDCVANGTGKTIEDMDKLRTALIRNRRR